MVHQCLRLNHDQALSRGLSADSMHHRHLLDCESIVNDAGISGLNRWIFHSHFSRPKFCRLHLSDQAFVVCVVSHLYLFGLALDRQAGSRNFLGVVKLMTIDVDRTVLMGDCRNTPSVVWYISSSVRVADSYVCQRVVRFILNFIDVMESLRSLSGFGLYLAIPSFVYRLHRLCRWGSW